MARILYSDPDVLVIDKPAGVSVHPREGDEREKTIVDEIRGQVRDQDKERPGIVHRLDKDTSGVLIIAKNPQAKAFLQQQFKDRSVKKTYLALVRGHPKNNRAVIELPVSRHAKNPMKRSVKASGKEATTEYKMVKKFKDYSLVEVYPRTGRTHQIRIHFAHIGHPIAGDRLYGKSDAKLRRHFLHAQKLEIKLPNGQVQSFEAELPPELNDYLSSLQ